MDFLAFVYVYKIDHVKKLGFVFAEEMLETSVFSYFWLSSKEMNRNRQQASK